MVKSQHVNKPDGTRIAYDVTGDGPALMLLHGAGKTRQDWHKLGYVERLKDDFKVITLDIRGTGESDFRTGIDDYAIEKIVADLLDVADACGAEQFSEWGYSFGGNIARYLGAWSDRVSAIAVIGIPFGPAVDEAFDRYIDEFVKQYAPLAQAYVCGKFSEKQRKSAIKGRIPVWITCFQAMSEWPSIDPGDLYCPALLLAGTKNKSAMGWLSANRDALDAAGVQLQIVEGLNHSQEFTKINSVAPLVRAFLCNQIDRP